MSSDDSKPPREPEPITPSQAQGVAERENQPGPITPSVANPLAAAAEKLARAARYAAVRVHVNGAETRWEPGTEFEIGIRGTVIRFDEVELSGEK